jgi:hypothetical protein
MLIEAVQIRPLPLILAVILSFLAFLSAPGAPKNHETHIETSPVLVLLLEQSPTNPLTASIRSSGSADLNQRLLQLRHALHEMLTKTSYSQHGYREMIAAYNEVLEQEPHETQKGDEHFGEPRLRCRCFRDTEST